MIFFGLALLLINLNFDVPVNCVMARLPVLILIEKNRICINPLIFVVTNILMSVM